MPSAHLTFRPKAGAVCWQKALRDQFVNEGEPQTDLSLSLARVKPVSRPLATQIILKYEWLGTMSTTGHHYGIFWGPFCGGVCCFAVGGGTGGVNIHKPFGVKPSEVAVLARGACVHWAPSGANSKLVSYACRLLGASTLAKLVLAYSDVDAGEIGTIYQACNWAYIGRGSSTRQWVAPNGRIYDQKLPYDLKRKHGGTRADFCKRLRAAGWREQDSNPKHRYVYVLDKSDAALKARIDAMVRPYPKRERSRENAAAPPRAEGGVIPTRSLHYKVSA